MQQIQQVEAPLGEAPVDSFPRENGFVCVVGGRSPPPRTQNSSYARGENVGALPRCGPVRGQGTAEFCPSIRMLG